MGLTNLCTKRQRIAELARSKRGVALSTLHHVIDGEWMKEAYRLTRKDGAPGIDGVMAEDYAQNLEANLSDLLERIKSGRYHAPPVRRAYIPKADGSLRPLGLPTFEDKVCQRAIVMVLELVYEQDFLSCSYGFRPGRSAHQALEDLRTGFMRHGLRWVIDLDIEKYFDSISHPHLRTFLDRQVTDGVIRRMIDKWLKAGVLEDGLLRHGTEGSPQGGVVSPCLSNIFLHHVLDEWFENEVKPRLKGRSTLVRYADDAVMAFEDFLDAQRVLGGLGKRLGRYELTLHPDKTRFVDFRWRDAGRRRRIGRLGCDRRERAPQATGVLGLVLGVEPGEHLAGALVDEVDEAEIPAGVADFDAREMPVAVRHLEAAALDNNRAVALPLRATIGSREGQPQRIAVGAGSRYLGPGKEACDRRLADLGMDLAVVLARCGSCLPPRSAAASYDGCP